MCSTEIPINILQCGADGYSLKERSAGGWGSGNGNLWSGASDRSGHDVCGNIGVSVRAISVLVLVVIHVLLLME